MRTIFITNTLFVPSTKFSDKLFDYIVLYGVDESGEKVRFNLYTSIVEMVLNDCLILKSIDESIDQFIYQYTLFMETEWGGIELIFSKRSRESFKINLRKLLDWDTNLKTI